MSPDTCVDTAEGSKHPQPVTEVPCFNCGQREVDHVDSRCDRYQPGDERLCRCGAPDSCACYPTERSEGVGRLPWPHGPDPVTDAWLRDQGLDPEVVRAEVREHIDTLIRRTEGDDRG